MPDFICHKSNEKVTNLTIFLITSIATFIDKVSFNNCIYATPKQIKVNRSLVTNNMLSIVPNLVSHKSNAKVTSLNVFLTARVASFIK